VHRRIRRKAATIVQAVHVDDCSHTFRHLRDSSDENAAATTDEEIASAGSESIPLNQRPIIRPHLELALGVRKHARIMATAKRASASPKWILLGRLRQAKTHMNVAAMASAKTIHTSSLGTQGTGVNSSRSRFDAA
jgi:hypothetical protein